MQTSAPTNTTHQAPLHQSTVFSSFTKLKENGELKNLLETKWDAIVVGSGMGGMACAAALAKLGKKVLILEQHYVAGGFTHTFSRKGFVWDVGVHCLGQMKPHELPGKLFRWLSNDQINMVPMGKIYESMFFPDGFQIDFPDDRNVFIEALEKKFPEEQDKRAIHKYFELVKDVSRRSKMFFGLKTLPSWASKLAGTFVKTGTEEYWSRTTLEVLNDITSNKKLQAVLTAQWGYYGLPPSKSSFGIHAMVARHYFGGGYYPAGGSKVIADTILETVKKAGGATLVRASVDKILIHQGKAVGVRMKDGEIFHSDRIVSAAGAKLTVEDLLEPEMQHAPWVREIHSFDQSPPHLCLYMGFEGDIVKAGASQANQWFFESWDIEDDAWHVEEQGSIAPVLYVSFPSLKDPLHDPGPSVRHTGEVVTFVDWNSFEKWKHTRRGLREPEYSEFKKDIEERMVAQLRKHRPELMSKLVYHELSTPLSTVHFTRAPTGGIYGLEASPRRFTSKSLQARTPVKGLFLAGGDVASLGVTGALMGGVLAAVSMEPSLLKVFK